MNDSITIHELELWTRIGVPESERTDPQRILVSVELFLDTKDAGTNDDVSKSINYADVAEEILELAKTERKTIECLAQDIASSIGKDVNAIKVTVTKFPLSEAKAVSITIER